MRPMKLKAGERCCHGSDTDRHVCASESPKLECSRCLSDRDISLGSRRSPLTSDYVVDLRCSVRTHSLPQISKWVSLRSDLSWTSKHFLICQTAGLLIHSEIGRSRIRKTWLSEICVKAIASLSMRVGCTDRDLELLLLWTSSLFTTILKHYKWGTYPSLV